MMPLLTHPAAKPLKNFPLYGYSPGMPEPRKSKRSQEPEVRRLLDELEAWCREKYGRQTEVAKVLGVDRKRLNDWFTGRIAPSPAVALRIQAFLAEEKRARRSAAGEKP